MVTFPIKLTGEQHTDLRILSARAGMTMKDFCIARIFGEKEPSTECEHEIDTNFKEGDNNVICKKCGEYLGNVNRTTFEPKPKPSTETILKSNPVDSADGGNLLKIKNDYKPKKKPKKSRLPSVKSIGYPKSKSLNKKK